MGGNTNEEILKSKVLIVGGTGRIGKWLVKASLAQVHRTYVFRQHESSLVAEKIQTFLELKQQGAVLVDGSFSDQMSLVQAVKLVDVVICAMGYHHHSLLLQLKLIDAIKEAGNVKRFVPAEFGVDPSWLGDLMLPGREPFDEKTATRKAIKEAGIPYTYILSNLLAMMYVSGLAQPGCTTPPRDHVVVFGVGNVKAIFVDEEDVAKYTIKSIDDPRTLNKSLCICPSENIMSHMEMVEIWEGLLGKKLDKTNISAQDFLSLMEEANDPIQKGGMGHAYYFFYQGYVTRIEKGAEVEEAIELYPEVKYTRIQEYLKRYL